MIQWKIYTTLNKTQNKTSFSTSKFQSIILLWKGKMILTNIIKRWSKKLDAILLLRELFRVLVSCLMNSVVRCQVHILYTKFCFIALIFQARSFFVSRGIAQLSFFVDKLKQNDAHDSRMWDCRADITGTTVAALFNFLLQDVTYFIILRHNFLTILSPLLQSKFDSYIQTILVKVSVVLLMIQIYDLQSIHT